MSENKSKFSFGKAINAFVCALLLSIGMSILLQFSFTKLAGWGFLIGLIGFTYWFYAKTNTKKRAWGRTFIGMSIESFLLPVVMFIFTIAFVSTQTTGVAEGLGGAIGGGIAIVFAAIFGGFLGIVFLIAGIFTLKSANKGDKK
jgi:hypothetical protein